MADYIMAYSRHAEFVLEEPKIITLDAITKNISSGSALDVVLVDANYTAILNNTYIGATKKDIVITLPVGVIGKVFVVKNQTDGNVKVQGSDCEQLDKSGFKTLAEGGSLIAVFDGFRWNLV